MWSDERVQIMKELWLGGRSATEIAARLGPPVTRNSVIGKVNRLHLQRGANCPVPIRSRLPRAPRIRAPQKAKPNFESYKPPKPLPEVVVGPEPLPGPPLFIESVPYTKCHYAIGTIGGRHHFCGHPSIDPTSSRFMWCKFHYRQVYQPMGSWRRR
jgi:GcrA cell cycle regulator